ncbi:MFS transporter [Flavihumibacter fluvii]|uniref:MFS transporter n=1 Tax=Flavihumibacter fluvii TaxID=2838157 RepID=UPI001EFBE5E3|nr:MFS transporter [Flavihumibacter fluvii]ULQ54046.1 MFS transporter [Flavihumibacter fluvii]
MKATNTRYTILAAVFINVVINYMDRSNISIAGAVLSRELELDTVQMGYVFSAFGWTYATLQIPGGILADRYGVRLLYTISLVIWSLATIGLGFVSGLLGLIILRVMIGAFEAPSYPMNNRIVTSWFPVHERASAIAMYTSGQFIGLAFLTPVLTYIQHYAGWRGLFFITGIIGVAWGCAWYFIYRSPLQHKKVNEAELKYIEEGGGLINRNLGEGDDQKKFEWKNLRLVLSNKKLWGIYFGQFCLGATLLFFLTWFPKYLVEYRKMDFLKSGIYASIPFLCAFAGVLFSGFLSDYLVKRNVSPGIARKTPIVIGLLLSVSIIGANYVSDPKMVIFFMSLAFFGNGLASITWVFVSLLAPKDLLGLTGGTFNFIGGLATIFVPIIIGYLVKGGDFSPALVFIGCMALAGAMSYIFLVGKVERIIIE